MSKFPMGITVTVAVFGTAEPLGQLACIQWWQILLYSELAHPHVWLQAYDSLLSWRGTDGHRWATEMQALKGPQTTA
jgi:hypothetical protein